MNALVNNQDNGRISRLCAQGGSPNPTISAIRLAKATLSKTGSGRGLPVNVDAICELRKVKPIGVYLSGVAGRLLSMGDHYVAEINASNPETRQRFTIGHEIGHTFFQDMSQIADTETSCGSSNYEHMLEERLCDVFAAEFLMPESRFREITADHLPSMKSVCRIAEIFKVSMFAAIRRIISLDLWPATLLFFRSEGNKGLKFRNSTAARSVRSRSLPIALAARVIKQQKVPCGRIRLDELEQVGLDYYTYGKMPHTCVCCLLLFK